MFKTKIRQPNCYIRLPSRSGTKWACEISRYSNRAVTLTIYINVGLPSTGHA